MDAKNLFRQEVFESKKNKNFGVVSINTPLKFVNATMGVLTIVLLIILFILFGEFSDKFVVKGYLNSSAGIVRVYSNKNGVIARSFLQQGALVKKGDKLLLIDTSSPGDGGRGSRDVLANLLKQKNLIRDEMIYKKNHLTSLKKLLNNQYISVTFYHQKYEEWVALENKKNLVEMEIIKYQQETSYVIRSPIDGVISSVLYQEGQYTQSLKPLVKILPNETELVAELFIPVKQSGFLHQNEAVVIRFDAYPYERFGTAKGFITEISQSILTDKEEDKPISIGQPYYKAIAHLDKQAVTVYGQMRKIQHGMTVSAVIVGSKRKLWQWILDPIYSFYGEVMI